MAFSQKVEMTKESASGEYRHNLIFVRKETVILPLLRSPEIDSKEVIPRAYVAWRAGTTTLFLPGS